MTQRWPLFLRRLTSSRFAIWLALLGWLAQLALPAAHSATMGGGNQVGAWCQLSGSGALRAQLAQLPDEIRGILDKATPAAGVHASCAQACAASHAAAPVPAGVALHLQVAMLAVGSVQPSAAPRERTQLSPPVRGPPEVS